MDSPGKLHEDDIRRFLEENNSKIIDSFVEAFIRNYDLCTTTIPDKVVTNDEKQIETKENGNLPKKQSELSKFFEKFHDSVKKKNSPGEKFWNVSTGKVIIDKGKAIAKKKRCSLTYKTKTYNFAIDEDTNSLEEWQTFKKMCEEGDSKDSHPLSNLVDRVVEKFKLSEEEHSVDEEKEEEEEEQEKEDEVDAEY
jgi:hypothetical protein